MATLASAPMESLDNSIRFIEENRTPEAGKATLAGVHLEGRYLNPKRRGAHATELLFPLDAEELEGLVRKMLPLPIHVSCAAELEGGEQFVKTAVRLGATVGMAHSDATWDEARKAVEWGVSSFTHTYNAMRPIHHREPGNMVASLMTDEAWTELICDGEHVHPAAVIAIDALAARESSRICTTIQVTDTGIRPGSGVGNHRQELSQKTLGIPVLAVGVPMVIDVASLVLDCLSSLSKIS